MICLIEALRRSSVFASVIIQGACEPRVFNLQPANTLRMSGFAKHVCRRGCLVMAFSSCFFAFADASAAGDASVSSDPSIQSVFESTVVNSATFNLVVHKPADGSEKLELDLDKTTLLSKHGVSGSENTDSFQFNISEYSDKFHSCYKKGKTNFPGSQ
jgi:hypothetical protein